jgi:hypothetical protein
MREEYRIEAMWTLPVRGTLGRKAENLYRNTGAILGCGWNVPRSMVIPYEYYQMEGGIYYMCDDIAETFRDCKFVAVRSNSPDEDLGERTPGLYKSVKINPHATDREERNEAINDLGRVVSSYNCKEAVKRRKRLGLGERGMSLLVQEWLPTAFCGSFSDIGETAVLLFTDTTQGIEAMLRPSNRKLFVDQQGDIVMNSHYITTYDQKWAKDLRRITNRLPSLDERGWELEFVITNGKNYVLQTTPIKKQPRFEVVATEHNIFESREVIGTGSFRTKGMLYLPYGKGFDMRSFNRRNRDYCLVVSGGCISKAPTNKFSPLGDASNARALFYVSPTGAFSGEGSFAAHAESFIRNNGCCGLVGRFTNYLKTKMSGKEEDFTPLFLDIALLIQADEIEQKTNVEIV